MFYRSPRLFLRPVFPEDWREIYEGLADERIVRMLATAPWPYRKEDARAFCRREVPAGDLSFAVTLPGATSASLIGMVGIGDKGDGPELGYWIAREHQGRGYATEAVRGALEVARALGIERVTAGHFLDNPASGRVLRKAGLVETGEIRPSYSLARDEQALCRRYAIDLTVPVSGRAETALYAA